MAAPSRKKLALVLGITGDYAFAAGCVLAAVRRHSPNLEADIRIYCDGNLPERDAALLHEAGATLIPYVSDITGFPPAYEERYSRLCLAKFECLPLLDEYETVIWLDADIAVQGDIAGLCAYGPFALAQEDARFTETGETPKVSINVDGPLPDLDRDAPNLNTGVIVFRHTLPGYAALYKRCLTWTREHAAHIRYLDQAVFNMLAQDLQRQSLFAHIPADIYNAHPRNPASQFARIVHYFGDYKLWGDGLLRASFPEWDRDYRRWLERGGSPWQGEVDNESFLDTGAFAMLTDMYASMNAAESAIDSLRVELARERALRERFEAIAVRKG
ncbi:MAG: hypothetical protein DELT_01359 [Desulfovibrio sp.]